MAEISLRRVLPEDIRMLSALAKQTFFDTFTGTCTDEDMANFLEFYYDEEVMKKDLASCEYFFAESGGLPIGYLSFRDEVPAFEELKGSTALELKRFYVDQSFHGKGVAHTMMNFFLDHAMAQAYDVVLLGVWEFNFRAQKFYHKYGFVSTAHRHDFPIGNTPQTDIYLVKFLN